MPDLGKYKLTFSDEFDARSISQNGIGTTWADIRSQWRYDANSDIGFGHSSFVDPASGYDPFKVADGVLSITAVPDKTASGYAGSWESGLISSKNSFSQTYGYFEIRADFSTAKGAWNAFWLLPVNAASNPNNLSGWQELDVVEQYGANVKGVYSTIHTTDQTPTIPWQVNRQVYSEVKNPGGYHTYGMDWQADKISFYVDGNFVGSQATPSDMHGPMYLVANLATQGSGNNNADALSVPITSKIDYIRAYAKIPDAVQVTPSTNKSGSTPTTATQPTSSDGTKVVPAVEAPKTVTLYNAKGVLASVQVTSADGTVNTSTYTEVGGKAVLATQAIKYAPGGAEASNTKVYATASGQPVLTSETRVHADKSKDVYLTNITGKSYVAERDSYNAAGTLTNLSRTHADGTLDYSYTVASNGTVTADQYDAAGLLKSHAVIASNGMSDTSTYAIVGGKAVLATQAVKYAPGGAEASNTKVYATASGQSVLTSETQVHADKSKDVYLTNITGKSYVAERDSYNAAGALIGAIRTQANGTVDYRYSLALNGTVTADQYDAAGLLKSHAVTTSNGMSDTSTYAIVGGKAVLATLAIKYAPGGAEASNTKVYATASGQPVLTSETRVHADKSKDVYLTNITGKSYVAERDSYNAAGALTNLSRTHADGTLDYSYTVASNGTVTADQYDAAGLLKSHAVIASNGMSDTSTYAIVGGKAVLATQAVKYAPGGAEASNTKVYATASGQSVLASETQVHADKSKDVYLTNITGKSYVAERDSYNAAGKLMSADQTSTDGSHVQTAYQTGVVLVSTATVTDSFKGSGGDTFVFSANFGKDSITNFIAGAGTNHDTILIDRTDLHSFAELKASHMSALGNDTLITVSPSDSILLKNVNIGSLSTENFRFDDHGLFHI
ncbi:family 16 glycosylhydrolase [Methylobacterium sp. NFXW15]|uniref:family 16 glycosylhydrolase n=1 Tax=Methylobacterium sp. NFXW15 TaxID=2819512 RepID=UPI003CF23F7B